VTNPLKQPNFRLDLIAVAVLAAVALAFFAPLLGGKKVLPQGDVVQALGMQKNVADYRARTGEEPYWTESMFSGMPAITVSVRYAGNIIAASYRVMDLGLPYPIGILFWGMLFTFLLARTSGVGPLLAAAGGLAYGFFSFHIAWIEAGHTNKIYALMMAPGVLWGLLWGYRAAVDGRSWVRGLTAAAALLIVLALNLYYNHAQMSYYLALVVLAVIVAEGIRARAAGMLAAWVRQTGLVLAVALIALLVNAAPLYPLYHYSKLTIRGPSELATGTAETRGGGLDRDYAYGWSYGRDELLTLIVPNTMGGGSSGSLAQLGKDSETLKQLRSYNVDAQAALRQLPGYWGDQAFTSGPVYLGAVVVFAFVLGLLLVDGALKWALLYTTLTALLLSLGKFSFSVPVSALLLAVPALVPLVTRRWPLAPVAAIGAGLFGAAWLLALVVDGDSASTYRLSDLLMDYLPLYNKFRVPSSMLVIVALTAPWLGLLGLQAATNGSIDARKRQAAIYWATGLTGGLCLLLALVGGELLSFSAEGDKRYQLPQPLLDAIIADRKALMSGDAVRSLLFIVAAGATTWLAATQRMGAVAFGAAMAAIVAADLLGVGRRFIDRDTYVRKTDYEAQYFQPNEAEELLAKDTSLFRVYPLSRNPFNDGRTPYFLNTVGGYNAAKLRRYQQLIEAHLSKGTPNVVNMLNTRYLITREPINNPAYPELKTTREGEHVQVNMQNYGPAWWVEQAVIVPTADAALDTLDNIDSRRVAVIEAADAAALQTLEPGLIDQLGSAPLAPDTTEQVRLVNHSNRLRRYATQSTQRRLLVTSEVYYPEGWTATVDGKPTPIVRVNFILRAVVVPAGAHTVEFTYDDPTVHGAERVSLFASVLLGLLVVAAAVLEWRAARKPSAE